MYITKLPQVGQSPITKTLLKVQELHWFPHECSAWGTHETLITPPTVPRYQLVAGGETPRITVVFISVRAYPLASKIQPCLE